MSDDANDPRPPMTLPYSVPEASDAVSLLDVFAGLMGAVAIAAFGGAATGSCCGIAWRMWHNHLVVDLIALVGVALLMCGMLVLASRCRRNRNPGSAIGLYVAAGLALLLFVADLISVIR